MPVFSKLCWPFNSSTPTAYITTETTHPTNGTPRAFADGTLGPTSHVVTVNRPARPAAESTISTPGPATPLNIDHTTTFGCDGNSDSQDKMADEGGSVAEREHIGLEQEASTQQDQAVVPENLASMASLEPAPMDFTMTDPLIAEPGSAKSLQTEAKDMSLEAGQPQVPTAAAAAPQVNDDIRICVNNDGPELMCEDNGHLFDEDLTVTSAHAAETIPSSPLPVYEQLPEDGHKSDAGLATEYPVAEEFSELSSDSLFAQQISAQFRNRGFGKGPSHDQHTHNTNSSNLVHADLSNRGEPSKSQPANVASSMSGAAGQFSKYHNKLGQSKMVQAPREPNRFPALPGYMYANTGHDSLNQASGYGRPGQFDFHDPRHNAGLNSIRNGAINYSFTGANQYVSYPMSMDHRQPPLANFGATSDQYAMRQPTPGYVQGMHTPGYGARPPPFGFSNEYPGRSMVQSFQFPTRMATPPVRLPAKRKVADNDVMDCDGPAVMDPEQLDDYDPSGSSDESDSDGYDSQDDMPLKDRSRQGGPMQHQAGTGSQSSYHDEADGDHDEDDEENDGYSIVKKEYSDAEQDKTLTVILPLPRPSSSASAGELLVGSPVQDGIKKEPTADHATSLGSPIAEASLSAPQPGANPAPESSNTISWKLPQYLVEVLPLEDNDDTPEVSVNLPGMPREILALTSDYANQEVRLLKDLFIPGQQALEEPDPSPKQALLNFHTVATMVLEAYTAYEVGDLHTKGSIAPDKDEDKELAALDASKDEIFFAVIDRWRVGLAEETLRPGYKLIRGAQEFCDIALDIIHYIEEHGFIEGPMMMRKERKKRGEKDAEEKEAKAAAKKSAAAKKTNASDDSPGKKRGRPKGAVHQPPVKKKAKTATAPKAKKGPTLSVVKRGKGDL